MSSTQRRTISLGKLGKIYTKRPPVRWTCRAIVVDDDDDDVVPCTPICYDFLLEHRALPLVVDFYCEKICTYETFRVRAFDLSPIIRVGPRPLISRFVYDCRRNVVDFFMLDGLSKLAECIARASIIFIYMWIYVNALEIYLCVRTRNYHF